MPKGKMQRISFIRRPFLGIAFISLILMGNIACKRQPRVEEAPPEPEILLKSDLPVDDPDALVHLTHGFYGLEEGSWRWAGPAFGLVLAEPEGAAEQGATLEADLNLSEVVLERLGPITLSATVEGVPLEPETFSEPGDATYIRSIPPGVLSGEPVAIEFTTDKALPPEGGDNRELSLIVTRFALTAGATPGAGE